MSEKRPHVSLTVLQLEELFDLNIEEPRVLRELIFELNHRKVPSAKALLKRVETTYTGLDARPLQSKTGAQLESLFKTANGDRETLRELLHELKFRKTQTSRVLQLEVEMATRGGTT